MFLVFSLKPWKTQLRELIFRGSRPVVFFEKVFLEISQNSQKNTCARVSFLMKLQASDHRPASSLKKRMWNRCFPGYFPKFLRTLFLQNPSGRLLRIGNPCVIRLRPIFQSNRSHLFGLHWKSIDWFLYHENIDP